VATAFLTTRECPWRCAMCDLWQHTTTTRTPGGAVAGQIASAREQLRQHPVPVSRLKLYNAGSFFDAGAVPEADYSDIARQLHRLEHVVVESHPALIGPRVDRLVDALRREAGAQEPPTLEVAMGLETANPAALAGLNKRMTIDAFSRAAEALTRRSVDIRAFVLIGAPFIACEEQDAWLLRSVDTAFGAGASTVSMVPTRSGNGAIEALSASGLFAEPSLADIERSATLALGLFGSRGRVFVDLWDLERFARCPHCLEARRMRLRAMNLSQTVAPGPVCRKCRTRR
jgi:radical SAM enzyme (TIGR01210 family)